MLNWRLDFMSRTITTNHTSAESETKVTIIYIQ